MAEQFDPRPVLELRIHGVNNSPPSDVLDHPAYDLEQVGGDDLAGFWIVKEHRRNAARLGQVPESVRREAYSWGGMARSSPGAGGPGIRSRIANLLGRIGWTLLLPYGLTNVAYWSRSLSRPAVDETGGRSWLGRGAAGTRAFGLGLTVLLISAVCEIVFDLVAVQSFNGDQQTHLTWLTWLNGVPAATRLAVASSAPVVVLVGLWFLTQRSQVRYEQYEPVGPTVEPSTDSDRILARPRLWHGGEMVRGLTHLHLAAGFAVIALASAWPASVGVGGACRAPDDLLTPACADQVFGAPSTLLFLPVMLLALGVLAVALWFVCRQASFRPEEAVESEPGGRRPADPAVQAATRLLAGSALLLIVQIAALRLLRPGIDVDEPLPGATAVPTIVVAMLVGIASSGIAWRSRRRHAPGVLGVVVAAGLLGAVVHPLLALAALGGLGLLVLTARDTESDTSHHTAWGGTAPGVLMALALLVMLTLTTLLVIGSGDVLNGDPTAEELVVCGARNLCVAPAYIWYGSLTVVSVVIVSAGVLVLAVVAACRRYVGTPVPAGANAPLDVLRMRSTVALAHRAERTAGALAVVGLAVAALAVFGSAAYEPTDRFNEPGAESFALLAEWGQPLRDWAVAATGVAAIAVVGSFVGGGLLKNTRPLGLVWDLICFLPRAAHPFAPPCYAERAVPELADRVNQWLSAPAAGRRVVLSAHSLGAVLAVAVLFVLDTERLKSVRLITYGVQLRPYFGRIFPDLLGPDVLGVVPCGAATLRGRDPWRTETSSRSRLGSRADTVHSRVDGRWISLWRRTDYLGFPACSYLRNDVDRYAEEIIREKPGRSGPVHTHSHYPRTPAYATALVKVLDDLVPDLPRNSTDGAAPTRAAIVAAAFTTGVLALGWWTSRTRMWRRSAESRQLDRHHPRRRLGSGP